MAATGGLVQPQQYVYADSEDSLPSTLICAVCHDVCGTHSACPGCSQTFCEVCVHKWFDVQRTTGSQCTCPYCRRKLRFSDLRHDPAIQQQLSQLRVLCSNAQGGCPAIMPRADLQAHLQHSCMYETVACRFCGMSGVRSAIQQHEASSCSRRLVPCSHAAAGCDASVPLDDMAAHVELNCPYTCKPCPHCSAQVARCEWYSHLQHSCPAQQCCPLRMYGCSFEGNAAAVASHSSTCPYQQHKQAMQGKVQALQAAPAPAAAAEGSAQVLANSDPWELPEGCVIDAAATFQAATARSCDAQVRQCLLDSLPPSGVPAKQEQQQQPQPTPDDGSVDGLLVQRLAAQTVGHKQLESLTPPRVFDAGMGDGSRGGAPDTAVVAAVSGMTPVEALAEGASGCFAGIGLQPDPLLESAWRTILNLAVVQVLKVQEKAVSQELSVFIMYSSICRAWGAVQGFCSTLETASQAEQQQQQQDQGQPAEQQPNDAGSQQQEQEQPQQESARSGATSSSGGTRLSGSGMLASLNALISGIGNMTTGGTQQPSASTQQQQQQRQTPGQQQRQPSQQQQRQQLTGRQIWQRWLAGEGGQQPRDQRGSTSSDSSGSDGFISGGSSSHGSSWDGVPLDGAPGLHRGLYDDEYTALEEWLLKGEQGPALMSSVAAAVYPLCLWLSVGGPFFWPAQGAQLTHLTQMASHRVGTLLSKLTVHAIKQHIKRDRDRQERAEQGGRSSSHSRRSGGGGGGAAGAARHAESPSRRRGLWGVRGLGDSGLLPVRRKDEAAHRDHQQQQREDAAQQGPQQVYQEALDHMQHLVDARNTSDQANNEFNQSLRRFVACCSLLQSSSSHHHQGLQQQQQQQQLLQVKAFPPGLDFATARQQLQQVAASDAVVTDSKWAPAWLLGFNPLVAAELSSALLLLHDIRADQCEVSLVPSTNTHVHHGYRGFWALSVLAAAQEWLGPGFRLSWQALAVLNDMVVVMVDLLCEVLGDSFLSHSDERVPMSPALTLSVARLVLPGGLMTEGLPHLLKLSLSYRDASCDDLSDITWELLTRKLGLVVELDKMVSVVNELLPVTFMDEDDDDDDDDEDETDEESGSTDGYGDTTSSYDDDEDEDEEDEDESYMTEDEEEDGSYTTDVDAATSDLSDLPHLDNDTDSDEAHEAAVARAAARASAPDPRRASTTQGQRVGLRPIFRGQQQQQHGPSAGTRGRSSSSSQARRGRSSDADSSSSGDWESADEEEAAALEEGLKHSTLVQAAREDSGAADDADAAPPPSAAAAAAAAAAASGSGSGDGSQLAGPSSPAAGISTATRSCEDATTTEQQPGSPQGTGDDASSAVAASAEPTQPAPGNSTSRSSSSKDAAAATQEGGTTGPQPAAPAAAHEDWRQQWSNSLSQLSRAAAASSTTEAGRPGRASAAPSTAAVSPPAAPAVASGTATAAATHACAATDSTSHSTAVSQQPGADVQQQGQQHGLNPYAAQLLQEACNVAMRQPEQLMLHSALSPADMPEQTAQGPTAAAAPAAGARAGAAAAAGDGRGDLSLSELHLRVGAVPPAELLQQLGSSTAQGTTGTPATAAARRTAGGSMTTGRWDRMAAPTTVDTSRQRQQRQQQQQEAAAGEATEPGDACTHAVVLMCGVVEVLLHRLLRAAGEVAAADPAALTAASAGDPAGLLTPAAAAAPQGAANSAGTAAAAAAATAAPRGGGGLQQVFVTAKHVQLAVAEDPDLTRLLLNSWFGDPIANAVGFAGAAPSFDSRLLPDAASEPLTAYLLRLAEHTWQQQEQEQEHQGSTSSSSSCQVVYPADLRVYCGVTVTAPPRSTPVSASTAATAATATAADTEGEAVHCAGPSVSCCFMSGWQCSSCATRTTSLAAMGFEAQMQACEDDLKRVQQLAAGQSQLHGANRESDDAGSELPGLSDSQLQQLLHATRLYHLQQPAWYTAGGDGSTANQVQLQEVQALLQPLRDVVALREIHLQQQEASHVLPAEYYEQLVQDALLNTVRKRQQQQQQKEAVWEQLRRLTGPSAGTSAAAAAAGVTSPHSPSSRRRASGLLQAPRDAVMVDSTDATTDADAAAGGSGEEHCELSLQPDAMQLLQQAAEDFLVQQFASANRLALHAGRQDLQPQDLRLALSSSGHSHMLPEHGGGRAGTRSGPQGVGRSSSGSKQRRVLGAPRMV